MAPGPGSYDVKIYNPVFQYKPSSEFASKTLRSMEQRKGKIANKFLMEKMNMT